MSEFRFSPNPNRAHLVKWQPWSPAAFTKAQEEDKPVLLSISAVWCYWCHVMDDDTYSDPEVQDLLNDDHGEPQNRKYRCAIGSVSAGSQTRSSPSARTSYVSGFTSIWGK